ncbi:MAG: OprD family outer membrane porin [Campylobacterota bacterium]|nr:OprD family outer membrane porin [Campylobacterota bacterium]
MKLFNISVAMIVAIGMATTANATLKSEKITLKNNRILEYNKLPSPVDTVLEAFSDGIFYGRIRTNMFMYDWRDNSTSRVDNRAMGIGGSFIYKTAPLFGLSATAGLYTSQNPSWFNEDVGDVGIVKSGKDTFSRYDTRETGNYGMTLLGQAYLQYDIAKTSIIGGRQLFESVFTKSNDTKMVPNAFDGITATIKDIDNTTIKIAYLAKQKLRDHTTSHDVIAYNGWEENDDSAVNKNLTVAKIGDNNSLSIASISNKSIKNLKADISYALVPDLLSNLALEAQYTIPLSGDWKVAPAIRYMQQFDHLNSSTSVANLSATSTVGYKDPNSLDTNLLAIRLDVKKGKFLTRLAYSQIADEADFVTPWRGFPTAGFTRAIAQYNWRANTKVYMLRTGYEFGEDGLLPGFTILTRYAIQDFDDKKDEVQADSNVLQIELQKNIGKNLEAKVRLGFVSADNSILKSNGVDYKSDVSYNEYRFELNYFF